MSNSTETYKSLNVERRIGSSQWFVGEETSVTLTEPLRISKKEIGSPKKLDYWTNRLKKREERLAQLVEKYGDNPETMPENIRARFEWRKNLVESAKSRIGYWQEVGQGLNDKIQKIYGGELASINSLIIYQPEIDKATKQRTGRNLFYTVAPHGPYGAPKIIENGAETGNPVGNILPTIFMDPESSQIYVLTEKDPDAKLQTGSEQRRAVRASNDNIITGYLLNEVANDPEATRNELIPGVIQETGTNGLTNAARILGFVRTGGVVIMKKPSEELLNPTIAPEDRIGLKAITIEDYVREPDLMGQGTVLKLFVEMMKKKEISVTATMPKVRKS